MLGNSYSKEKANHYDAFIVKWDSTGQPIWSTFFGGNDQDVAYGLAIDKDDNIIIAGRTMSTDLPIVGENYYQDTLSGKNDCFVAKFTGDGDLLWSSYYGASNNDIARSVAVDDKGDIFFAGETFSKYFEDDIRDLRITWLEKYESASNGFITKFSSEGKKQWTAMLGKLRDEYINDIEVYGDEVAISGWAVPNYWWGKNYKVRPNMYITGTEDAIQKLPNDTLYYEHARYKDPFLAKFTSDSCKLKYFSYYGTKGTGTTTSDNTMYGIEYDVRGRLYMMGNVHGVPITRKGSILKEYLSFDHPSASYVLCLSSNNKLLWDANIGGENTSGAKFAINKNILWYEARSRAENIPHGADGLYLGKDIFTTVSFLYRLDLDKMEQWYSYHPYLISTHKVVSHNNIFYITGGETVNALVTNRHGKEYSDYSDNSEYFMQIDFRENFGWTDIEDKKQVGLELYPSIANEKIHIISNDTIKEIKIYDLLGKEYYWNNKLLPVKELDINISELGIGVYYIQINKNKTIKFIKN